MGERRSSSAQIVEAMAGPAASASASASPVGRFRAWSCHPVIGPKLNSRDGRISDGHFQISSGLAPPAIEKKMMLARPTRFSSGTKPTVKRLSVELSRLSPIMK